MGILNSKQDVQDSLKVLQQINNDEYDKAINQLSYLSKEKSVNQISKWDLLLLLRLNFADVKKLFFLITDNQEASNINIHVIVLILILSRQEIQLQTKLENIINLLCFDIDQGVDKNELLYIFDLVYQLIFRITSVKLKSCNLQENLEKELYQGVNLCETKQLIICIVKSKEIQTLNNLFSTISTSSIGIPIRHITSIENNSKANTEYNEFQNQIDISERDSLNQQSLVEQTIQQQKQIEVENQMISELDNDKNNKFDITTVDLLYSFDIQKISFQEDLVQRMYNKLKQQKSQIQQEIDQKEDSNFTILIQQLSQIDSSHLEFYAQKQITSTVDSIFFEQRLSENNYSLLQDIKEKETVIHNSDLQIDEEQNIEKPFSSRINDSLMMNQKRMNIKISQIYKEINRQDKAELKYVLNKHFYMMLIFMRSRGQKKILEKTKYTYIGELSGINQILQDIKEGDNQFSSDDVFQKIYKSYQALHIIGSKKGVLVKMNTIRNNKKKCKSWVIFWQGVIKAILNLLSIQCFKEIPLFAEYLNKANMFLKNSVDQLNEYTTSYNNIKKELMDYNFQIGQLKALHIFLKIYKEAKQKLIEVLKIRQSKISQKMENIDIQLISSLVDNAQRKRYKSLYFQLIGEQSLSKCIRKGLDIIHIVKYMIQELCKINIIESLQFLITNKKCKQNEDEDDKDSVEKIYSIFLKISRTKQIDEGVDKEDKNFEQFKNLCLKYAEEDEKIGNLLIPNKQPSIQASSVTSMPQLSFERKGTLRSQNQLKQKSAQKQNSNDKVIKKVNKIIEQAYSIMGIQNNEDSFEQQAKQLFKDVNFDINLNQGEIKQRRESIICQLSDFIEVDQTVINDDNENIEDEYFKQKIGTKSYQNDEGDERKQMAHGMCESYLKSLANFKPTRYVQQFKETRLQIFDEFIKSLKQINKGALFNNYDLNNLSLPLENSIETSYQCILSLEVYLRNVEKETLWQYLHSEQPLHSENEQSDDIISNDDQAQQLQNKQNENQQYQIFSSSFNMMKGITKIKARMREKILKQYSKVLEFINQINQVKNELIIQAFEEEKNLQSLSDIETYLTDKFFALSENEDIGEQMDKLNKDKQTLFERKKNRQIGNVVQGTLNYLQQLTQNQEYDEIYQKLILEISKTQEIIINENKNIKIQSIQQSYKEKSQALLKRLCSQKLYIKLLHLTKIVTSLSEFFQKLRELLQNNQSYTQKIEKVLVFIKANMQEESDDILSQEIGARLIHQTISNIGNFELLKFQTSYNVDISKDQLLVQYIARYMNKITFIDDKISSQLILRNDSIFGVFNIIQSQLIIERDKHLLKEKISEGLKKLINIYEIYKTPLEHYQRNFERVCRYTKREIITKIIDTDESNLKYQFFDIISKKGIALFRYTLNKVDQAFSKFDLEENLRLDFDKLKSKLKRELDAKLRIFKDFIDMEENQKILNNKQQQIKHINEKLLQEISALSLLVKIYYLKIEQEECINFKAEDKILMSFN